MPAETSTIIDHLEEKERKEGALPPLLKFYQGILRIQAGVESKIASLPGPGLSSEAILRRLERGKSLVAFDELAIDWPLLRKTFKEVTAVFAEYKALFAQPPEKIGEPGAGRLLTKKEVKAWFKATGLPAAETANGGSESLFSAIVQAAFKPFLASHARALAGSFTPERWRRRYCPVCGGSPDFAFLDKERGAKWLLCSRCDTEWLFQRLECPGCGNQDQKSMAYFTNDEGPYRLYVCEQCKQYLKAIDMRQTDARVLLPLERLYTLDLDRQAREQGYKPCHQDSPPHH